jgi:hypothetical protein
MQQLGCISRHPFPAVMPRRSAPLAASWLVAPLLVLPLLLAPAAAQAAPATEADMNLYTRIAAVNVCIARGAGVPFDKAVGIAGETIAQVIQGQHDGVITQVGAKPLSLDDLRKGSINSAVLGAAEICPKEVPADVMAKVQEALKPAPAAKPSPSNPAPSKPSPSK